MTASSRRLGLFPQGPEVQVTAAQQCVSLPPHLPSPGWPSYNTNTTFHCVPISKMSTTPLHHHHPSQPTPSGNRLPGICSQRVWGWGALGAKVGPVGGQELHVSLPSPDAAPAVAFPLSTALLILLAWQPSSFASHPFHPTHCPSAKRCCGPPLHVTAPQAWLLLKKPVVRTAGDWTGRARQKESDGTFPFEAGQKPLQFPFPSCQLTLATELQMKNCLSS